MRASFVLEEVVNGLRRNVTMTIAMILTTAISVGLLGGGLLVVRLIGKMQNIYEDRVEVVVFMNSDVSGSDSACTQQPCAGIKADLAQTGGVQSVSFENRQQAFDQFNKVFQSQPELRDVARIEAMPASLKVKMNDMALFPALQQKFSTRAGVDNIVNQEDYLGRLFGVLDGVRNATFAVALVQLSAFTRRTETGIMRLVGATRWYTQLPFLLEAMVSGLIGALLAVGALLVSKATFIDKVMGPVFSTGIFPEIGYGDIAAVAPIMLLVAAVISAVTGYVTLRLYVRL
jgi:cell division transport system permease protein